MFIFEECEIRQLDRNKKYNVFRKFGNIWCSGYGLFGHFRIKKFEVFIDGKYKYTRNPRKFSVGKYRRINS